MDRLSVYAGLGVTGVLIALFGIPLIPCYVIWSLVSPASGALALATVLMCIVVYIIVWFVEVIFIVIAASSLQ